MRPPFGLGWAPPSASTVRQARPASPPTTEASRQARAAPSREPGQPSRSSSRAAAQPKRRYLGLLWPTMASRVFAAR